MKDDIDYIIVKMLKRDARASNVDMARRLGVTEGTIRNRVKRMIKSGEIKFTVKHRGVEGLVLIKAKNLRSVAYQLRTFSDNIYEISGAYDIVVIVDAPNIEVLNKKIDKIRAIKGIIDTNTAISLVKR